MSEWHEYLVPQKVFIKSFFQKVNSPQTLQLILYCYEYKEQVDGFVRELTYV